MTDEEFKKWESDVFGYGYGTGEKPVLRVLKRAFNAFPESGNYDFQDMEEAVGKEQFWLLLNILLKAPDVLNYGTSPRYGWLDPKGKELKAYLASKTVDELYAIVMKDEEEDLKK